MGTTGFQNSRERQGGLRKKMRTGVRRVNIADQASELMVTSVSPGGAEITFCDPPHRMSIQNSSARISSPNMADTESTTVRIP